MSLDHRRILIADDDLEFRSGVAELLHGPGRTILQAGSGSEAVTLLRGESLHLALIDMHMPGYTGLEVLQLVARETLGVPCIFWSADATDAIERMALAAGARAVLRKPVEPTLLRREVHRALEP